MKMHASSFGGRTLGTVCGVLALIASAGTALAYSKKVNSACRDDYFRFCPSYEVGSAQLRQCMRAAGRNLSKACRDALADAGEAPRSRR